jgi:hypothetical protein
MDHRVIPIGVRAATDPGIVGPIPGGAAQRPVNLGSIAVTPPTISDTIRAQLGSLAPNCEREASIGERGALNGERAAPTSDRVALISGRVALISGGLALISGGLALISDRVP